MTPLDPQDTLLFGIKTLIEIRTELILTNMLLMLLLALEVSKVVVGWVRKRLGIE